MGIGLSSKKYCEKHNWLLNKENVTEKFSLSRARANMYTETEREKENACHQLHRKVWLTVHLKVVKE